MRTEEIITRLFCMVDDKIGPVKKRKNANLYTSEIITIGILFCLKGMHYRAFYRWLKGDWHHLFPNLPSLGRLLRVLEKYEVLTDRILVEPEAESIIDSYGIELIHPIREGRSPSQVGKKGKSNHRWIGGVLFYYLITGSVYQHRTLPLKYGLTKLSKERRLRCYQIVAVDEVIKLY